MSEELEERIKQLEIENGELKGRTEVAEKRFEDAKKAVQTYIDEIQRTAVNVKEMLRNTGIIQEQGNMVRRRLAKVQTALMAADNLVNGYRKYFVRVEAGAEEMQRLEKEYTEARKELKTTDAQPDNPAGG